jgi:hypothetical protein
MSSKPVKKESNYMVIQFPQDYGTRIVVPFKAGVALMAALENAERYVFKYSDESKISDLKADDIHTQIIGEIEYAEARLRSIIAAED